AIEVQGRGSESDIASGNHSRGWIYPQCDDRWNIAAGGWCPIRAPERQLIGATTNVIWLHLLLRALNTASVNRTAGPGRHPQVRVNHLSIGEIFSVSAEPCNQRWRGTVN